ncbi:DUF6205 family protein [Nonomuraea sp. NPDC051941]|uniref:DUF6205 family protein n=1 Tax=Nonomuraea sp. NPDC051941 TaxID=3364373 RepID=UPI0037C56216
MSYRTYIAGRLDIEPPIPWGDIADSEFLPYDPDEVLARCIEFEIEERDKVAVAILSVDPHRQLIAHGLLKEIQRIIDRHGDGRTFAGVLWCRGNEPHDLWQLRIVDGKAVRVDPWWPPMPASQKGFQ